MVTLVGMQDDFGSALKELVELEYDTAINRFGNEEYKMSVTSFMEDHIRHIKQVSKLLQKHNEAPPNGSSLAKKWITKGKVVFGNLVGVTAIRMALRSNKIDTNTAYERMRNKLHEKGCRAVIPFKKNRLNPESYDKEVYKVRHLIEKFFAKLKQYRGIATRYNKTSQNFLGVIYLVASIV